jgi:hypothetical protein
MTEPSQFAKVRRQKETAMLKHLTAILAVSLILAPAAIAQGTGTSSSTTYSAPETNTPSSTKPGPAGQPDAGVTNSVTDQEACKTLPSTGAQPPKTPGSQAEPQPQARCQAK